MSNNSILIRAIITFILGIIFGLALRSNCDAAQWEIVSFNNAEHLVALQDSVVGICDTTVAISDSCLEGYSQSWYYGNPYDTLSGRVYYHRMIITCRELVGVTMMREQGVREIKCYDKWGQYSYTEATMKPGEAIIFYEEVKGGDAK